MDKSSKIYIAGHRGMVGSSILRKLSLNGYNNLITKKSDELDLIKQEQVDTFFKKERPKYVFIAAAKVGGILANNQLRAEFIYNNLMIQNNLIHSAHKYNVEKLIFLGSSCIYPKFAKQPIKEEYLLNGELELTNEPYAIAKISGIKMCESYYQQYRNNFISLMPTNLYGPNDNFDLKSSHVLPALLRKFHEASKNKLETVEVWGTGKPQREFLHVDDLADACLFVFEKINAKELYENLKLSHLNVGTGVDISINELATMISKLVGFKGIVKYNDSFPDGTPRKLLDVSAINELGWESSISLNDGIESTYNWFLKNK